jgi:SAM-dependent methyltransferase
VRNWSDRVRLAQLGIHVTLLDSSPAMLDIAKRAAGEAGVADKVVLQRGDATQLANSFRTRSFDVILSHNIVLLPVDRWSVVSEKALRFAWGLSDQIRVLHVECGEETESLCRNWGRLVETPAKEANLPAPELVLLKSPFRFVVKPIVEYALNLERENSEKHVAVILPELVERRWYYLFLHNHRSSALKALLYLQRSQRISVINVPWYLSR